jgi:hypothetical protein
VERAANFLCMHSNLYELVIVIEFYATEAYSSLDLIRAKYGTIMLSMVEMKNATV